MKVKKENQFTIRNAQFMIKASLCIGNCALCILASLLIITASANAQGGQVVDQVMAVVGNKIILQSEIDKQYAQYVAQTAGAKDDAGKCMVFSQLLLTKLMLHQ